MALSFSFYLLHIAWLCRVGCTVCRPCSQNLDLWQGRAACDSRDLWQSRALLPPSCCCSCTLTPLAISCWHLIFVWTVYSYWLMLHCIHIKMWGDRWILCVSFEDAWPAFDFETCFESWFIYTVQLFLSWWVFSKTVAGVTDSLVTFFQPPSFLDSKWL